MSIIRCKAPVLSIGSWRLILLPKSASAKLPSRGMTVVTGTINGFHFQIPLEPDGKGSHWFMVSKTLCKGAEADAGDTVTLAIEPSKQWPEPTVPTDVKKALAAVPQARKLWMEITPMARWDWIRWIRAVKTPQTRQKHIDVALDKLNRGIRRPCCFNRNLCSEPYVANNWVLKIPN